MSTDLFTHDFFQEGRRDALSEVRILQHSGQWTREKRASWMKEARATRSRLHHTHPGIPEGRSYHAGRIAALGSRRTTFFTEENDTTEVTSGTLVCRPLPPNAHRFCGLFDCSNSAIWGISNYGNPQILLALCDPCRQEWQRWETTYTTEDGWDWDEDQQSDLPGSRRMQEHQEALLYHGQIALPFTFFLGFGVSNALMPVNVSAMLEELCIVAGVSLVSKPLLRLLFFLVNEVEE